MRINLIWLQGYPLKIDEIVGVSEGVHLNQEDRSIFLQNGRLVMAVSSAWFIDNIDSQDTTHTPKDDTDIVDCGRVVEIAEALDSFLRSR